MKHLTYLLLIVMVCSYCTNNTSTENENTASEDQAKEDQLRKDMIVLHDEVMPFMGAINKTQKELKEQLETIEDEAVKEKAAKIIEDLDKAHEGMMDWMHKNSKVFQSLDEMRAEMDHDAIIQYLNKEKADMQDIKELTNDGIKEGTTILNTLMEGKQ